MSREHRNTFKLVRNIMNIKKMFKNRHRKRKKDPYDPDQPSYLLMLVVEPSLFEKIFSYLDYKSVAALERTCTVLRKHCNRIVISSIYLLINNVKFVLTPLTICGLSQI